MELKNIVPWGRSFGEYQKMFSLTDEDLSKRILGCSDGPASFNTELTSHGGNVVSVDPIYQFDALSLSKRISEVYDEVIPQMHNIRDRFIWKDITSIDMLGQIRMKAMELFLADYEEGRASGRYVCASLPQLPFENKQFDLALCSHYLFLYSKHVGLEQHIASVKELCRVAQEFRIYPLLTLDGELSPHLEAVMTSLNEDGLDTSLVSVAYEFQKGATEMLVVK